MHLYFRVLWVLISSFFKPKISSILETSVLRFKVLPNDLDFNMHMNNGRYLTIMDLGRFDLVLRAGLLQIMLKQKSVPILGSATIRYRLPLMPFQSYELHTRIVSWDDKWAYMEQRFVIADGGKKHGAVAAVALVKGSFYDQRNKRTVPTKDVLDSAGLAVETPEIPEHIVEWQKSEDFLREVTKQEVNNDQAS